jgi:hypothetical protein
MNTDNLTPLSVVIILALFSFLFYVSFTISDEYLSNQDPKIETNI